MQINVPGQATFFYFLSKEQAGIQFFFITAQATHFLIWCGSKCLQEFTFAVWQFWQCFAGTTFCKLEQIDFSFQELFFVIFIMSWTQY